MKRQGLIAATAATFALAGMIGVLLHGQAARANMPAYKVIQLSPENAGQLEKMLNEQSAGGWSLHSEVDEKLFIFERK